MPSGNHRWLSTVKWWSRRSWECGGDAARTVLWDQIMFINCAEFEFYYDDRGESLEGERYSQNFF